VASEQNGSSHGAVCLQTWYPRQASKPYVQVCSLAGDGYAQRSNAMSGYGEDTWKICGVSYSPVGNKVIPSYDENASMA